MTGHIHYSDGVDVVRNALSIFAGKKSIVVHILVRLYLPPADRQRMENLSICTVSFSSDCKAYGHNQVVGGDPTDPHCTSIGGSMRRLEDGLKLQTPEGKLLFTGGLVGLKGDNPDMSGRLAMKESMSSTTKQPCKQCMALSTQLTKVDLNKSFLDHTNPPFPIRTTQLLEQHIRIVAASRTPEKQSQIFGLQLASNGKTVMEHAYMNVPSLKARLMEGVGVEIAHDELLENWPQQCYLCWFFWIRDTTNPNHFTYEAFSNRWDEYPFRQVAR